MEDKTDKENLDEKKEVEEELHNIEFIKLQQELKDSKNKYLILLAENENSRKRMQKEKSDMTRFAVENIISEFLTPIDSFSNALSFAEDSSDDVKNWSKGFEMILSQFKHILNEYNIIQFDSEGKTFDPHLHEAIEIEESDEYEDNIIIKEFLKGYKCGDRIIRPARVKVSKKIKKDKNNKEKKNESKKI